MDAHRRPDLGVARARGLGGGEQRALGVAERDRDAAYRPRREPHGSARRAADHGAAATRSSASSTNDIARCLRSSSEVREKKAM